MTKMATIIGTMPIYGEKLLKSSSLEPKDGWPWNLVCTIEYLSTTKSVQMMPLSWLTYLMARTNLALYAFVWEKVKTMDFSETIVVYDIKVVDDEYMKLYEYQSSLRFSIFPQ